MFFRTSAMPLHQTPAFQHFAVSTKSEVPRQANLDSAVQKSVKKPSRAQCEQNGCLACAGQRIAGIPYYRPRPRLSIYSADGHSGIPRGYFGYPHSASRCGYTQDQKGVRFCHRRRWISRQCTRKQVRRLQYLTIFRTNIIALHPLYKNYQLHVSMWIKKA